MAYKISKSPKNNPNYYEDLEIEELRKKYKGKKIPFFEAERVATRKFCRIQDRVREKDKIVQYEGNFAIVHKVTKKGIFIEKFKIDKDGFDVPSGKVIFVSNAKAEHIIYPDFFRPTYMLADLIF